LGKKPATDARDGAASPPTAAIIALRRLDFIRRCSSNARSLLDEEGFRESRLFEAPFGSSSENVLRSLDWLDMRLWVNKHSTPRLRNGGDSTWRPHVIQDFDSDFKLTDGGYEAGCTLVPSSVSCVSVVTARVPRSYWLDCL
jgi:hypothetical protein